MGRAAFAQTLFRFFLECIRGEGHDWRRSALLLALPLAHDHRRLETVHDRHLHVHQHQIVGAGLKLLEGHRSVFRHIQLIRGLFQKEGDHIAIIFQVFYQ